MPLINGLKMACEPCIRGHRSTKCNHADERLMVPVRKPGRPLSSCPHPSSRPCVCTAVTAAIPRKQKCGCGTSGSATAGARPDGVAIGGIITPPSPSKPSPSAFRVQKPAPKPAPGRKQSIDPTCLERIHSSQLNILPVYDGTLQQQQMATHNGHMNNAMPGMPPYGAMGPAAFAQNVAHPRSASFPMLEHPTPPPAIGSPTSKPATNGHSPGDASNRSAASTAAKTSASCCGEGTASSSLTQTDDRKPMTGPSNSGAAITGEAKRGCCSSSATVSPEAEAKIHAHLMTTVEEPPMTNGALMQPFQAPQPMPNSMYPYFPHPTVFAYPPQYGSYLQPLQPEQWRHVMSMMGPGHTEPSGNAFDTQSTLPIQLPPAPEAATSWTSHQCTCGDSCQCIGCAAHPYNDATQHYVRSAWNTMNEDAKAVPDRVNGHNGQRSGSSIHDPQVNLASDGTKTPVTNQTEDASSTTAPQTPSDAASGVGDEQTLSASDFFFVSYPFGDSCAGEMASCPCGDDCQCIGCAIHSNPAQSPII